jgi:pimeloyl-ACP methyl ester carboxylesterase
LLAADGPLDPSDPAFNVCSIGPLPADTPSALRNAWPSFFTAEYAASRVSLHSSLFTHRYDSADHLDLGDMPLVVLSADYPWALTERELPFWGPYTPLWYVQHEALARLSSRGVRRVVEHSGHSIQLDQPQAVINAVDEVLRQLR